MSRLLLLLLSVGDLVFAFTQVAEFDIPRSDVIAGDSNIFTYVKIKIDVDGEVAFYSRIRPFSFNCYDIVFEKSNLKRRRLHLDRVYHKRGNITVRAGDNVVFGIGVFLDPECHNQASDAVSVWVNISSIDTFSLRITAAKPEISRASKRDLAQEPPKWVSLNEIKNEVYVWLKPTMSAYGHLTLALMGGLDTYTGKFFVELPSFEEARYVLWVPGLVATGPHFTNDAQAEYIESRELLVYSARDAAWLLWNYKTQMPVFIEEGLADHYWRYRLPAVPADIPGLLIVVRPRT